MMPFFCIYISHVLATCLKRGGIFKHEFVANLPPSRLLKKNLKIGLYLMKLWPRVWGLVFLTHGVDYLERNEFTKRKTEGQSNQINKTDST